MVSTIRGWLESNRDTDRMADFTTSWAFQKPSSYYASFQRRPSLSIKFCDIDDKVNFQDYLRFLQDVNTHNFVLDFGNEDAWCGVNLEQEDIAALLGAPVRIAFPYIGHIGVLTGQKPTCFGTRWINIWNPEEQKETIKVRPDTMTPGCLHIQRS